MFENYLIHYNILIIINKILFGFSNLSNDSDIKRRENKEIEKTLKVNLFVGLSPNEAERITVTGNIYYKLSNTHFGSN